jgi:hypothetical protein
MRAGTWLEGVQGGCAQWLRTHLAWVTGGTTDLSPERASEVIAEVISLFANSGSDGDRLACSYFDQIAASVQGEVGLRQDRLLALLKASTGIGIKHGLPSLLSRVRQVSIDLEGQAPNEAAGRIIQRAESTLFNLQLNSLQAQVDEIKQGIAAIDRAISAVGERTERTVLGTSQENSARIKESLTVTVSKLGEMGEALERKVMAVDGHISDSVEKAESRTLDRLLFMQTSLQAELHSGVAKLSAEQEAYRKVADERYLRLKTLMQWAIAAGVVAVGILVAFRLI